MGSPVTPENFQEHQKWIKMEDAHAIMASSPSYQSILFSDSKTRLVDYMSSLKTSRNLEKFLPTVADINTALPDDSPLWPGSTPLHLAVMFSEDKKEEAATKLIRQLLNQGASIQLQNRRGATPLHLAFRLEKPRIVALLLLRLLENESGANLLDDEDLSHLHIACAVSDHRNVSAIKLLQQRGIESTVNVAYKGNTLSSVKTGWTPLHVAVHQRRVSLVETLLERGASTTCKDARGYSALHLLFGNSEEAKPMADVILGSERLRKCVVDSVGLTHLHVALWFDNDKAVRRLLDLGANIDATIDRHAGEDLEKYAGFTPIDIAVILRHSKIMETLLSRGANILLRNHDGRSPLSRALTESEQTIAKAFIKIIRSDEELQKRLEEDLGLTMLHIACYRREVDQVKAELKKGADVNARLREDANFWAGYTPLHVIVLSSDAYWFATKEKEIFKLLLDNGCDVNQQDINGKTALHLGYTLRVGSLYHYITPILLSRGADINIVDKNGDSVVPYALKLYSHYDNSKHSFEQFEIKHVNNVIYLLLWQMQKMKLVGIETSKIDENLAISTLKKRNVAFEFRSQNVFYEKLQATERIKIGERGLSVRSFLHETHAISIYPSLTPEDRLEWAAFFKSLDSHGLTQVNPLLRLQYAKAVARSSLINPACDALKTFICSNFPDLCVDIILKYLSNSQLKHLIAAAVDTDE